MLHATRVVKQNIPIKSKSEKHSEFEDARKFVDTYMHSAGFNQRLSQHKYKYPNLKLDKSEGLTKGIEESDVYNAYYRRRGDNRLGFRSPSAEQSIIYGNVQHMTPIAHELGHNLDFIIDVDPKWNKPYHSQILYSSTYPIFRKSRAINRFHAKLPPGPYTIKTSENLYASHPGWHDAFPSESYGDLMDLRYSLYKSGIYDSTKKDNPFTQQHLNDFRKKYNGKYRFATGRLFDYFSDQDIIEMMNTVAQNNVPTDDNQPLYAKRGGTIYFKNGKIIK